MTERGDPRPGGQERAGAGPQAKLPVRPPAERKPRPDPGPIRIAIGLTGMATASALVTAFLSPVAGVTAGVVATVTDPIVTAAAAPQQTIRHVTRYVQLQPGQTAPPQAVVQQAPAPKPRVVIVTTKQSGQ